MGSRHGREEEKPVHKVWVDAFLMDQHEVTQAEYEKIGKLEAFPNPSHFQGADLPVEQVTWPQAARYCNARSRLEGLQPCYNEDTGECDFEANGYRLPTEAEWEYACRAGTDSDYSFGERTAAARRLRLVRRQRRQEDPSRRPEEAEFAGPLRHARQRGRVVPGCLRPGLLQDQPREETRADRTSGNENVLRGGSWKSAADALRSAYRIGENPGFSDACLARDAIGFRCVRKAPASKDAG